MTPVGLDSSGQPLAADWFALRVQHQHEKAVAQHLTAEGLETFLPLYRTRRIWSDRVKELELPLFSGYVFCRLPFSRRLLILTTPGVRSIVGFGSGPAPVRDEEITGLKTMMASGLPVRPWPYLKIGQRVRIERGPLLGLEGILLQFKGSWRLVMSVEILQRSVAVEVDRLAVRPAAGGAQIVG